MRDQRNQESGGGNQPEPPSWLTRYVTIKASVCPQESVEAGQHKVEHEVSIHLRDTEENPVQVIMDNLPAVLQSITSAARGIQGPMIFLEFGYYRLPDAPPDIWVNTEVGNCDIVEGSLLPAFAILSNDLIHALQHAIGGAQ